MPRISKTHIEHLINVNAEVDKLFEAAINSIVDDTIKYKGKKIKISDYPELQKKFNKVKKELHDELVSTTKRSVTTSWGMANSKNNARVFSMTAKRNTSPEKLRKMLDPHLDALEAFLTRKEKGLNLSNRVWKNLRTFAPLIEDKLQEGIDTGMSAAKRAKDLTTYLRNPDKKANINPGRGVYKSPIKNAKRLVRTENNIAYRTADFNRWQSIEFIVGIEIRLSNRHPAFDICDHLKGKYPKDFKWVGWHPQCLCNAVPIQLTDEEYNEFEKAQLQGKRYDGHSDSTVYAPPNGFYEYLNANRDKIRGYSNIPYYLRDNPEYKKLIRKQNDKNN